MKTLLRFILNLTVTVAIMIPCIFFFKRLEELCVLDWLEVMIILGAMSIILILISKLIGRNKNKSRIKEIASTITVIIYLNLTSLNFRQILSNCTNSVKYQNYIKHNIYYHSKVL